jgi:hypothetical protein
VIDGIGLEDAHTCEFGNFSANRLKIKNVRITKKYVSLVDIKSWYGKNGTNPSFSALLNILPKFNKKKFFSSKCFGIFKDAN